MRQMDRDLGRVLTAMATPFDAEGRLDLQQASRLAGALLASGTEGLVVTNSASTSGISPWCSSVARVVLPAQKLPIRSEISRPTRCDATETTP